VRSRDVYRIIAPKLKEYLLNKARYIETQTRLLDREKLDWLADTVFSKCVYLLVDDYGQKRSMGVAVLLMKEAKVFFARPVMVFPVLQEYGNCTQH